MPETQLIVSVQYALPEDKPRGAVVVVNDCVCSTSKDRARFVGLAPGRYTVRVVPRGIRHAIASVQADVVEGEATTVSIKLPHYVFIYFSICYRTGDDAFKRASDTWRRSLSAPSYRSGVDQFFEQEVSTEAEFVAAWTAAHAVIASFAAPYTQRVALEGRLWTHASMGSAADGLEFQGANNTLTQSDIAALQELTWHPSGLLYLHSCNSGLKDDRSWCPAEEMHKTQGIGTIGQTGYAYFSTSEDKYVESTPKSQDLFLWAYRRGKNKVFGDGGAMPPATFGPVATAVWNKLDVLSPFLWKECRQCAA
jgi:hypothetical protein